VRTIIVTNLIILNKYIIQSLSSINSLNITCVTRL